jgi:ParB-like chromosome segregation protein Spo0J
MSLIKIDDITIGERIRKDFGNLEELAESMRQLGQLQPIAVTSKDPDGIRRLVFGERRLRAARDILKWEDIDAKTVDLDSIILGEFHENEMRKDFTVSERVAIGKAIEEYLGNRQGQRTDKELPKNFQEVHLGMETKEIAAEKAGFGNQTSYRQARKVVDHAEPELVQAVDNGAIRVSQAAKVAEADPDIQRKVATLAQEGHIKEARQIIREVDDERRTPFIPAPHKESHEQEGSDFTLEADAPDDGYEWVNTLDTIEDIFDHWVVVLEGIRERGGIREFLRHWPDAYKLRLVQNAEQFNEKFSGFIREMKDEISVITLN